MIRRHRCLIFAVLFAGLMSSVLSVDVHAQTSVGLVPFRGTKAVKIRQRLQNTLRANEVSLVSLKKMSANWRKTKSYAKIARRVKAKYVIRGLVKRGKNYSLTLDVYNRKGKRARRIRVYGKTQGQLVKRAYAQLKKRRIVRRAPVKKAKPEVTKKSAKPAAQARVTEQSFDAEEEAPRSKRSADSSDRPRRLRAVVGSLSGISGAKVRMGVVRSFKRRPVDLVPVASFKKKAKSMRVNLKKPGAYAKPARAMNIDAVVVGDVEREYNMWSAFIRVVDGDSGKVLRQQFFESRTSTGLSRIVQREFWNEFGDLFGDLQARVNREERERLAAGESRAAKRRARQKKRMRGVRLPDAIDIEVMGKLVWRNFKYNDDLRGGLRPYQLKGGPGISTKLQWYPGAHFTNNVWSQFGIDFDFEYLFEFTSQRTSDGAEFPTKSRSIGVGLLWRYPLKRVQPALMVGYGIHRFEVLLSGPSQADLSNTPQVPGVNYRHLRIGAEVRADLVAGLKLTARAAYLPILSAGGIHSRLWFPEGRAGGIDAEVLIGYAIPAGFEIRIGLDYRRYFHNLRPVPPDPPWVAGGALDQYWGLSFGVGWRP